MSKTATLNLRIDPETKASAEKVLSQLGLSMSTAIEVYLRQIILNGEIPFYISSVPQEGTKRVLSLKEIREKAIPLAAQYGVKRLYLFGSYARGEAKPTSDIDFYIEKGSVEGLQLVSLQLDLEKALGKTYLQRPVWMKRFVKRFNRTRSSCILTKNESRTAARPSFLFAAMYCPILRIDS